MILLNQKPILCNKFPDGTFATRINGEDVFYDSLIEWRYESEEEMSLLYYLVKYLKGINGLGDISLLLPYIPNARMDRVKNEDEIFTLKYFCEFINSLGFSEVIVRDPHSNVSVALLNNVTVETAEQYLGKVIDQINDEHLLMYYPDEGAMKRYSELVAMPYTFGVKRRDWRTGDILGITLINEEAVADRNILIVDDICSKGGTFYHSAKALKAAGAKDIYLYVTHCENTIFKGELINSDLIKHIYTTPSIFTLAHEKITVLKLDD